MCVHTPERVRPVNGVHLSTWGSWPSAAGGSSSGEPVGPTGSARRTGGKPAPSRLRVPRSAYRPGTGDRRDAGMSGGGSGAPWDPYGGGHPPDPAWPPGSPGGPRPSGPVRRLTFGRLFNPIAVGRAAFTPSRDFPTRVTTSRRSARRDPRLAQRARSPSDRRGGQRAGSGLDRPRSGHPAREPSKSATASCPLAAVAVTPPRRPGRSPPSPSPRPVSTPWRPRSSCRTRPQPASFRTQASSAGLSSVVHVFIWRRSRQHGAGPGFSWQRNRPTRAPCGATSRGPQVWVRRR